MPFICSVQNLHSCAFTILESTDELGEKIVRVGIGQDTDTGSIFSAFVCLSVEPGYGNEKYELVFYIVEMDQDGTTTFHRDGLETLYKIPDRAHRQIILQIIRRAVEILIDEFAPENLLMTTHEANLPNKALLKYHDIAQIIKHKGYTGGRADPYHGLNIWMFRKP